MGKEKEEQNLTKMLTGIQQNITSLDQHLQDLFKEGSFEDYCSNLQPIELAKLEATLAFIASSLSTIFYKLSPSVQADLTDDHPIFLTMNRAKSYLTKVNKQQRSTDKKTKSNTNNNLQKTSETVVQETLNLIMTRKDS